MQPLIKEFSLNARLSDEKYERLCKYVGSENVLQSWAGSHQLVIYRWHKLDPKLQTLIRLMLT